MLNCCVYIYNDYNVNRLYYVKIGTNCGFDSVLFTKVYSKINNLMYLLV